MFMLNTKKILIAIFFAIPLLSSAQDDTLTIVGKPINEVVVTARLEMNREDINFPNTGQNLPYLLTATPSLVTMSDDGLGIGYTYFRVRGTDMSRINMTINGIALNDAESQNVFWVNMTDMSSSLASMNVQRGVGTSVNGTAAFGASVNMSTIDAALKEHKSWLELSFNGGMYNTFREMVAGQLWLTEHWRIDGRFSKVNSDGYLYRAASDLYSYHSALGYYTDKTNLTFSFFGGREKTYMAWDGVTKEEMETYGRRYNPAGKYIDDSGQVAYYPDQNDIYAQQHAQIALNQQLRSNMWLSATLHYTHGKGYYEEYKAKKKYEVFGLPGYITKDENGNDVYIKKSDFVREKHLNNHNFGADLSYRWLTEYSDAQFGAAASRYLGDHYGNITYQRDSLYPHPIPYNYEYYRNEGKKTDANIYAKTNIFVINRNKEKLTLYADLQYRYVNYKIEGINSEDLERLNINETFHFFNPKAGITYQNSGHQTYFNFAIANREPTRKNYTESGADELPKSERLYDFEAGYTFSHQRFQVGANLYFMYYRNQLVPSGKISSTGSTLTLNVDKSYRMGIELTGGVKIVDKAVGKYHCDFRWDGNLTLSRNKIIDFTDWFSYDDYSAQEERHFGTTDISFSPAVTFCSLFTLDIAGLTVTLQTNVVDKQYLDNTMSEQAMLKAYTYTNFNAQYLLPLPKKCPDISLKLQINNLFDSKYEANGWSYAEISTETNELVYMPAYYPQAGINVHAGISVRF